MSLTRVSKNSTEIKLLRLMFVLIRLINRSLKGKNQINLCFQSLAIINEVLIPIMFYRITFKLINQSNGN
jgi:hypothetical protein